MKHHMQHVWMLLFLALAPSALCAESLSIGFGSCVKTPQSSIWESILEAKPDVFVFLGDNIYLSNKDIGRSDRVRQRYQALGNLDAVRSLRQNIDVLAIWDDHDFGPNNADSSYEHSGISLKEFRKFWGTSSPHHKNFPESVNFKLIHKGVTILGLDNRSFRVNPGTSKTPTMFGDKQLRWIEKELSSSTTPYVILLSGGQLLSEGPWHETLAEYEADKARVLTAIQKSNSRVIILSGDRHFSEVLSRNYAGKEILEFTSSPLSSSKAPSYIPSSHALRKTLLIGENNFGMLRLANVNDSKAEVRLRFHDSKGRIRVQFFSD